MSELEPVVIELNPTESKTEVKLNNTDSEIPSFNKPSVNFGGGIELLMNDKKRGTSK